MEKYNFIIRLFIIAPIIIFFGFVWAIVGLFSTKSLGKILKKTGENLLND